MDKLGQVLLYLVRHSEVDLDKEGKIRGLQNQGLNAKGERDAAELARFFEAIPLSGIYSDDLKRTYQTAIAIARPKKLRVTKDVDLRSWDVGSDLEGKSIDANEDEIKELKQQPHKVPVGGESWGDYGKNTISAFSKYVDLAMSKPNPLLVVIHGSWLQVVWAYMGEMKDGTQYDATPLKNSGVAAIYATRKGLRPKILRKPGAVDE